MRLIDADEVIKTYEKETGYSWNAKGILECPKCFIDNAPTVEPETKVVANVTFDKEQMEELVEKAKVDILAQIERPQGEWIKAQGEWVTDTAYNICFKCSECDGHFGYPFNFCPNCGADMRGDKE